MTRKFLVSTVLLAMIAATPAVAATPINESRPLAASGSVSIENIKGRIIVRTWAQPQVKVTGSLGKGVEKLIVEGDGQNLSIRVKYPNHNDRGWMGLGEGAGKSEPTMLEVTIPQRASLDIDSVSADVNVQQMAGRKLSVESVSGNVEVTASSPGEASFENVSGDTTLRITTNKVSVESVSGDINLRGGLGGDIRLESVSGNASLVAPQLSRLQMSTVSGDANLQVGVSGHGSIKAESVSGNVVLALPNATNARLDIETFSGDIESPSGKVVREEFGPGKSLHTRLGTGEADIDLESFSGDVTVKLD